MMNLTAYGEKTIQDNTTHGVIFDIQRFSTYDGPGIRTTVFFKGCPLKCKWCHNPESQNPGPEVMFDSSKCIDCGCCEQVCPQKAVVSHPVRRIDRNKCQKCGRCVEVCVSEALTFTGRNIDWEEVVNQVERDKAFYARSKGGVTFSGGEPLLQNRFLLKLLKECKKRGLHTAVDTCGHVDWKKVESILPYVDLFLYDVKQYDPVKHKNLTGVSNKIILDNLRKISRAKIPVIVRVPIIPGLTDQKDNIKSIARFLRSLPYQPLVEPLGYHQLGVNKYKMLGVDYPCQTLIPPSKEKMENVREIFRREGVQVINAAHGKS